MINDLAYVTFCQNKNNSNRWDVHTETIVAMRLIQN